MKQNNVVKGITKLICQNSDFVVHAVDKIKLEKSIKFKNILFLNNRVG